MNPPCGEHDPAARGDLDVPHIPAFQGYRRPVESLA
jgi:hypothetical protein